MKQRLGRLITALSAKMTGTRAEKRTAAYTLIKALHSPQSSHNHKRITRVLIKAVLMRKAA